MKNSWGRKWGGSSQGHFYAAINTNAYCLEEYIFVALPEGYDMEEP